MRKHIQLNPSRYHMLPVKQFFDEANQDSDAASCWWLGDGIKEAEGLIMIVKGNEAANKAYNLMCNHGLITPGKPVVDKK